MKDSSSGGKPDRPAQLCVAEVSNLQRGAKDDVMKRAIGLRCGVA
jgi:hypothetical protein